mmetsp:Transcript_9513/g.27210  ORF Transcript_9513/g.27210 Transcript_9513/m.27210 type:complete len:242 (-) Transcript_9513:12-737(-)
MHGPCEETCEEGNLEVDSYDGGGVYSKPQYAQIVWGAHQAGDGGVAVEHEHGDEVDGKGVPQAAEHPQAEHTPHPVLGAAGHFRVDLRVGVQCSCGEDLLCGGVHHGGQAGPEEVVRANHQGVEEGLGGETRGKGEVEVGDDIGRIFIEGIEDHLLVACEVPVAMHQQEAPQVGELCKGEVGGHDGSSPLAAADAAADVGRLDHPHVVRAVANSENDGVGKTLHELRHLSLLLGGHPAAHH